MFPLIINNLKDIPVAIFINCCFQSFEMGIGNAVWIKFVKFVVEYGKTVSGSLIPKSEVCFIRKSVCKLLREFRIVLLNTVRRLVLCNP